MRNPFAFLLLVALALSSAVMAGDRTLAQEKQTRTAQLGLFYIGETFLPATHTTPRTSLGGTLGLRGETGVLAAQAEVEYLQDRGAEDAPQFHLKMTTEPLLVGDAYGVRPYLHFRADAETFLERTVDTGVYVTAQNGGAEHHLRLTVDNEDATSLAYDFRASWHIGFLDVTAPNVRMEIPLKEGEPRAAIEARIHLDF